MLLNLLKRDLKLHWDALVIPLLLLVVIMAAMALANEGAAFVGLILCSFLFIPVLPMAIHVREAHTGTLGDLLALPVSRNAVVTLRYLEVLICAAGLIALAHLGVWIALSASAHKVVPFQFMDRSGGLATSVLLLLLFAYPMPFALRWGGKGMGLAFGLLIGGFMALGFASELIPALEKSIGRMIFETIAYFLGAFQTPQDTGHPMHLALVFLCLFSLSYVISRKAFAGKDL